MAQIYEDEKVLALLIARGIIDETQKKRILANKRDAEKKLRQRGHEPTEENLTVLDVIEPMRLKSTADRKTPVTEELVARTLADDLGYEFKRIDPLELDLDVVTRTIPQSFAIKHLVVPVAMTDGLLEVVAFNPTRREVFEDIERVTKLKVAPKMGTKSNIIKIIREFFGFKSSITAAESILGSPLDELQNLERLTKVGTAEEISSSDTHVKNSVDYLFNYAFDQRASDMHFEPKRDYGLVRMRIDGILHDVYRVPKRVHPAMVARIKALSRMDVAEKRRPQDGRIKLSRGEGEGDTEAEIRVSVVPVAFGEKAVLRFLDPTFLFQALNHLGFTKEDLVKYFQMIRVPHGIILVTGPTGSGKTTTLYSTLKSLANPQINITTIEDPVEMIAQEFNQISVNPAVGVTFDSILRYILRQDPDVLMVGEMRDNETVVNAIQAALTGHLVFSTVHTNDAPSTFARLIDLEAEPFLVSSTVIGIIAQRLLRTNCPHCSVTVKVPASKLLPLKLTEMKPEYKLRMGKGCIECRHTGYLGRTAVFEILPVTEGIRDLIHKGADPIKMRELALEEGMVTLKEAALERMWRGDTTHREVMRVILGVA